MITDLRPIKRSNDKEIKETPGDLNNNSHK